MAKASRVSLDLVLAMPQCFPKWVDRQPVRVSVGTLD